MAARINAADLADPPPTVPGEPSFAAAPIRPLDRKWQAWTVLLLASPMITAILTGIYGWNSTRSLLLQYALWAVCGLSLAGFARQRQQVESLYSSRPRIFLWTFLAGLLLSVFFVYRFEVRFDINAVALQTAALAYMTLPFFAMHAAAKSSDLEGPIVWTAHAVLVLCVYSIASDFLGFTSFESGGGRYFGFLGDQAAWALTFPLLVFFSSSRLLLAGIAGLGLALTASRAPALVALGGVALLMVFSSGHRLRYFVTFLLLGLIAVFQAEIFNTLISRIGETQLGSSDRAMTAAIGLRVFNLSPIFGSGYNSLTYFYPASHSTSVLGILPAQTSTFVQMLSDGGLLLFLPYVAFVLASTVAAIAVMRRSGLQRAVAINGLAAWLVAMLWINQSALWFVVGSYIGPLVFGGAGIVSGYWVRLRSLAALRSGPGHAFNLSVET